MAHNNRVRANLTAWSSGAFLPAEIDAIDQAQFQSINGDLGGVWAPSAPIQIGGLGLTTLGTFTAQGSCIIEGDELLVETTTCAFVGVQPDFRDGVLISAGGLTVNGECDLNGPTFFENTARFNAAADFYGNPVTIHEGAPLVCRDNVTLGILPGDVISINGNATFTAPAVFNTGATARFNDAVDCFGGLLTLHNGTNLVCNSSVSLNAVNGTTTINGAITANSTLDLLDNLRVHGPAGITSGGTCSFQGAVNLGSTASNLLNALGTLQLNNPLSFTGLGRVPFRTLAGPNNINVSWVAGNANLIYIPVGQTDGITYTVLDDGAVIGDFFLFVKYDPSATLNISAPGHGTLAITSRAIILAYRVDVGNWLTLHWDIAVT